MPAATNSKPSAMEMTTALLPPIAATSVWAAHRACASSRIPASSINALGGRLDAALEWPFASGHSNLRRIPIAADTPRVWPRTRSFIAAT